MLAAAGDVHEAVGIDMAQVAGGDRPRCRAGRTQVAQAAHALDLQFAIDHLHPRMRQRPSDAAQALRLGPVQGHHRGALGQAVAFEHRQLQRRRTAQQARADAATTDRQVAQRGGQRHAALGGHDQPQQQLRHQDHAVRLVAVQAGDQGRNVQAGSAAVADLGQRRQRDLRAGQQRRVQAADVLQQRRQRHQAQVPARRQRRGGVGQRVGDLQQRVGAQAHALRLAGGAGGVGDAAGARGQGHRRLRQAPASQSRLRQAQRLAVQVGQGRTRRRDQPLRTAAGQGVLHLRRAEEGRQRHVHAATQSDRQVQQQPLGAVVQAAGDAMQPMPLQRIGQTLGALEQIALAQRPIGVKHARVVAAQAGQQVGDAWRAHGAPARQARNVGSTPWRGSASRCRKACPAAMSPNISRGCAA
ncbi:hypothetical protein NB705_003129 [Xanthomonas sacchari]|nr:hypothetical protein [Xanthomonas sacchari]